jgi:hypothetical protein
MRETILAKRAAELGITEEEVLTLALQRSEGSIEGAAKLLRAFPQTLRSELHKRGLRVVKQVSVRLEKVDTL